MAQNRIEMQSKKCNLRTEMANSRTRTQLCRRIAYNTLYKAHLTPIWMRAQIRKVVKPHLAIMHWLCYSLGSTVAQKCHSNSGLSWYQFVHFQSWNFQSWNFQSRNFQSWNFHSWTWCSIQLKAVGKFPRTIIIRPHEPLHQKTSLLHIANWQPSVNDSVTAKCEMLYQKKKVTKCDDE